MTTLLSLLLTALLLASPAFALDLRPEIVFILADDLSTQASPTYGETDSIQPILTTANIDLMAAAGQLYLNAGSEPVCSPSRRDYLYGMNPLQHGAGKQFMTTDSLGQPWEQRISIVSAMQAAGYRVVFVGKYHSNEYGLERPASPFATPIAAQGFDEVFAYMQGNPLDDFPQTTGSPHVDGNHHYYWIETNPTTGATSINTGYTTDVITAAAVSVLQDADPRPLFLIVSYSAPHAPYNPPPGEVGGCGDTTSSDEVECYEPAITYIDSQLPLIFAEMDFTEDHAIWMGDNGRPQNVGGTQHCPAAEAKTHATPCGTRVPLVVRGAGVVIGEVSMPVMIADIHDTVLEIAGGTQYGAESISFASCFADPTGCATRSVGHAIRFRSAELPLPMYSSQAFTDYQIHLWTPEAGNLYGLLRAFDDNDEETWTDTLLDLGSATVIDETKRYGQDIITVPDANAIIARDRMQDEALRIVEDRWQGPPNQMVDVTMVGVETR